MPSASRTPRSRPGTASVRRGCGSSSTAHGCSWPSWSAGPGPTRAAATDGTGESAGQGRGHEPTALDPGMGLGRLSPGRGQAYLRVMDGGSLAEGRSYAFREKRIPRSELLQVMLIEKVGRG